MDTPSSEYERVEAALKAADVRLSQADQVWDVWEEHGEAVALGEIATLRTRYKDSSLYAQAINVAGQETVDKLLQGLIAKVSGGGRATVASSGPQSVATATKTAKSDPIARAFMGDLRDAGREL